MKFFQMIVLTGLLLAVFCATAPAQNYGPKHDVEAVKRIIETAYIQGVHLERDSSIMAAGFHPSFAMLINKKNNLSKYRIKDWMKSVDKRKMENPDPPKYETTWNIPILDVTGNAALVKVEILRDGKLIYTDYLTLYKFHGKWKIVSKIYHSHR